MVRGGKGVGSGEGRRVVEGGRKRGRWRGWVWVERGGGGNKEGDRELDTKRVKMERGRKG